MLGKVYSFLDWDGWSGERVVLRPDVTISVARLYLDSLNEWELVRLFYVTNMFALGTALNRALGKKQGIVRMAYAFVPMDEALAVVAVDMGGRVYSIIEADSSEASIGDLDADLVRHFLVSLASEAKINLQAKVLSGINDHHKAEALFKAVGRALDSATRIDERILGRVPSTKEIIEG
jgi:imidazoleglycerol-phosphate dehydratase